jgi:hypothetical protein
LSVERGGGGGRTVYAAGGAAVAWPTRGLRGLEEQKDGPWPVALEIACRWDQGYYALTITCEPARSTKVVRHPEERPRVRQGDNELFLLDLAMQRPTYLDLLSGDD